MDTRLKDKYKSLIDGTKKGDLVKTLPILKDIIRYSINKYKLDVIKTKYNNKELLLS